MENFHIRFLLKGGIRVMSGRNEKLSVIKFPV